jgi:hypothetical protein
MNTEDVSQAILIETRSNLKSGWLAGAEGNTLIVMGPDAPDFVSEVWRIARFIAYDEYVSLERQAGHRKEYKMVSRSRSGLGFEVIFRAKE